jgi:hypothetical protein
VGIESGLLPESKLKEDLNISLPAKSRKMKIELQIEVKPLIMSIDFNQVLLTI